MDPQRVERQHGGGFRHQATFVRGNHDGVQALAVARLDLDVHTAVGRQRKIVRRSRFGLWQRLTRHHHPATAHQVLDQRGLPIAPHPGTGGLRVRFRQRVHQFEQLRVPAQRLRHGLDGLGVVEVASGGRDRQQQVVADHLREQFDVGRRQSQPLTDRDHQVGPEHAVISSPALADVVQQRAERQQVGPRHAGWSAARR